MTEGRLNELTGQDSGLPGDDPAGFFKQERQRYGWPTPEPPDWFEKAAEEQDKKRKHTPIYDKEREKWRREAGPDADHDAATTNFYDTLALSLAVLADRLNNTAKVIELLLDVGLDRSDQSPDPEKADKKAREMFETLGEFRSSLKGFRPW